MSSEDPLLTVQDVALLTRTPAGTVRFWVRSGRLRAYKPARRYLIERADLQTFLSGTRREEGQ